MFHTSSNVTGNVTTTWFFMTDRNAVNHSGAPVWSHPPTMTTSEMNVRVRWEASKQAR